MAVYECYVDGASRGQGVKPIGYGAIAVVIFRNHKKIGEFARALGQRTNNEAEYEAVFTAVMMCWAADLSDPLIYSDSQLVTNQVNGLWQVKQASLYPIWHSISQIAEVYHFRVRQVPRNHVSLADALANQVLDDVLNTPFMKDSQ